MIAPFCAYPLISWQRAFDPVSRTVVNMTPLPEKLPVCVLVAGGGGGSGGDRALDFLGECTASAGLLVTRRALSYRGCLHTVVAVSYKYGSVFLFTCHSVSRSRRYMPHGVTKVISRGCDGT